MTMANRCSWLLAALFSPEAPDVDSRLSLKLSGLARFTLGAERTLLAPVVRVDNDVSQPIENAILDNQRRVRAKGIVWYKAGRGDER